jgi:hypothetical protein
MDQEGPSAPLVASTACRRKLTRKLYPPSPNTLYGGGMLNPSCVGTPSLHPVSLIISTRLTAWHGVNRSEAPARVSTCHRRAPERCGLGQVCEVSGGEPRAYRRIRECTTQVHETLYFGGCVLVTDSSQTGGFVPSIYDTTFSWVSPIQTLPAWRPETAAGWRSACHLAPSVDTREHQTPNLDTLAVRVKLRRGCVSITSF